MSNFERALKNPEVLCISWEQVPGRWSRRGYEVIIENALQAAKGGRIHAVSVTDNPGGRPSLPAAPASIEIKKAGIEPLVHLATRDRNRNEMESLLYGLQEAEISNLLVMSGDYPSASGFKGRAKPVFDLDSVQTVRLVQELNLRMAIPTADEHQADQAVFFPGVVISPFKLLEAELMGQYMKLEKKIAAGAQFVILQTGYDTRKWHEVLQWLRTRQYAIPVIATVQVLTYSVASAMSRNLIPGCRAADKIMAEVSKEGDNPDKGRKASLMRAAKMYAIAKGMGFSGVHIGGFNLSYEMVDFIIEKGEELYPNWPVFISEFDDPQDKGFYLFSKDPHTGLNSDIELPRKKPGKPPFSYQIHRMIYSLFSNSKSPLYKLTQALCRWLDHTTWAKNVFKRIEYVSKAAVFNCQDCGDCALPEMAYLCPMANCPKNQRNGPCGGSQDGWCEVYPREKGCVWVQVYERLKASREDSNWASYILPPQKWELYHTSSCINLYLKRDHHAEKV